MISIEVLEQINFYFKDVNRELSLDELIDAILELQYSDVKLTSDNIINYFIL